MPEHEAQYLQALECYCREAGAYILTLRQLLYHEDSAVVEAAKARRDTDAVAFQEAAAALSNIYAQWPWTR